jgi:hypothetical protein
MMLKQTEFDDFQSLFLVRFKIGVYIHRVTPSCQVCPHVTAPNLWTDVDWTQYSKLT